jgi:purine-cytosine permease-like protein
MANTHTPKYDDYVDSAVPMSERRGPITMGLLWITMVTAFPSVLIGFQWYKEGITLPQVLSCISCSCLLLLVYSIPATQLGAKTGLGYATLCRSVFGKMGSQLIAWNLLWIFTASYGMVALLMSEALISLFHLTVPIWVLTPAMAILMSLNNLFGFKGVANFARFVAAPVMIFWIGFTFTKAINNCPASILTQTPHVPLFTALTSISSFVVGYAVWGNEQDYWRFSRPKVMDSTIPLSVALIIGQVIFPVTGWLVARLSGVTEYGAATALMNQYSFGGLSLLAAIVLGASYFACNDSNLFGLLQAAEHLKKMSHQKWALLLGVLGAACGAWLSTCGSVKAIEALTSLNCVIMPTPTVILLGEWFLQSKVFKENTLISASMQSTSELPFFKFAACTALTFGLGVGVLTSGLLPAFEQFHFGISSMQAWLAALIVYLPLRVREYKRDINNRLHETEIGKVKRLALDHSLETDFTPASAESK